MNRFKTALIVVFALAFILRYAGIYPGYNPFHPDEGTSYDNASQMILNQYKPDRFDYAAGMALIHAVIYRTVFVPAALIKLFVTNPESLIRFITLDIEFFDRYKEAIFGYRHMTAMYWSRFIAATFGGLAVVLLYFVGKRLFSAKVGLFAAVFLAFNYRHALGSHLGLPDVHQSLTALLTLYAGALLLEKNTARRYMFAASAAALTFSFKYQPFAALIPIFVHLIWTLRTKKISYLIGKNAWIAVFSALATFLLINPYYFANIENAFFRNRQDIGRYQMGVIYLRLYPYFYLFHWGVDRLPSLMVVVGALFMLLRNRLKFFLVLIFPAAFISFMTYFSNGGIFTRNFTTPIPFLMLFAGYGFSKLLEIFWPSKRHVALVTIVALLIINYRPIKNIVLLDINYMKPWNLTKLDQWFDEGLPANSIIRVYQLFIGEYGHKAVIQKNVTVLPWDWGIGPNSLAEFSQGKTDFAIMQLQSLQSVTYWWRQFPRQTWLFRYSEVPYDYILESFFGLTMRELLPHTVVEFVKPYQAASEFNFMIFKIPRPPLSLGKLVTSFRFNENKEVWKPLDPFNLGPMSPTWDPGGRNNTGSIKIPPGGGDATTRIVSDPIPIEAGTHYTARGWIKNITDKPEHEDGFLRIDYYADTSPKTLSSLSLDVAISQRATSSGEWSQVQANAKAPESASFMTVSFQRKNPAYPYTSFVDDVEVYESEPAQEAWPELPQYRSNIHWRDVFYPTFL